MVDREDRKTSMFTFYFMCFGLIWMYTYVKIPQAVYLILTPFTVSRLYLNLKNKKGNIDSMKKTKRHHPQISTYIGPHPKTEQRFSTFLLSPPNIIYIQTLHFESQGEKYNSCHWSDHWVILYWCSVHIAPRILGGIISITTSPNLNFLKQHRAFTKWSWD